MIFPNISLGRNTKRYTHNMSFDNNTTLPFGVVQPLMSQRLEPNAKISVNMRQLVRLAPMPVPTFARLNMTNEVSFVPTVDVCPYYEALVSQMSYSSGNSTFYPTKLPQTNNSFLLWLLLFGFDDVYFSVYKHGVILSSIDDVRSLLFATMAKDFFGGAYSQSLPFMESDFLLTGSDILGYRNFVSLDGADFVFSIGASSASSDDDFFICFRFGSRTRRFRDVLVGLGYSLNASDTSPVSIIPLLSYYKAWFDLYYPVRDLNWTDTNAYKVIKFIEDYSYKFDQSVYTSPSMPSFKSFLSDCHDTFYTSKDDFVSVHRDTVSLVNSPVPNIVDFYGGVNSSVVKNNGQQPFVSKKF